MSDTSALSPRPVGSASATPEPVHTEQTVCASCGTALVGAYCHVCGEKTLDHHDYALGHWLEHTVDAFTHFDLKVPRSLWSLLRRPGVMTADVLAGRRVAWAKPLQAFLIANVIYYAVASWLHLSTFETPLQYHLSSFYGDTATAWSTAKAASLGIPAEEYATRFDALAHALSKTLVVLFVPVFAAVFALLEVGKKRYALEHVTVAVHFTTLVLLLLPLPYPIVFAGIVLRLIQGGDDLWTLVTAFLMGVYGAAFLRRVYGDSRLVSVLKAVIIPFAFYTALAYLYRPVLFGIITALL